MVVMLKEKSFCFKLDLREAREQGCLMQKRETNPDQSGLGMDGRPESRGSGGLLRPPVGSRGVARDGGQEAKPPEAESCF